MPFMIIEKGFAFCIFRDVRIQSELVTLDNERNVAKTNVDNILSKIGEIEHSVKELELEMHRLCVVETEQQSSALNNAINYETKDKKNVRKS